jgi:hypothetical protein
MTEEELKAIEAVIAEHGDEPPLEFVTDLLVEVRRLQFALDTANITIGRIVSGELNAVVRDMREVLDMKG